MKVSIHPSPDAANAAAAALLTPWLTEPGVRNVMLAGGNTPLELYGLIGAQRPLLAHLHVFALDEYANVPLKEPRNCANLVRRAAVEPWGVPAAQYYSVNSTDAGALASIQAHERRITEAGGVDVIILGLGQNGHLGFNEPGSAEDSPARVVELDAVSIAANREWFGGDCAPAKGATVGMKTILAARRVLLLAYGTHKSAAASAMIEGPRTTECPASLLQGHPHVHVLLDKPAAAGLRTTP